MSSTVKNFKNHVCTQRLLQIQSRILAQPVHTGCSGKNVFFLTIHCNPSIAYIAVRDLQSSQRNASVVTPIGWQFLVQLKAAECWQGRGGKL